MKFSRPWSFGSIFFLIVTVLVLIGLIILLPRMLA